MRKTTIERSIRAAISAGLHVTTVLPDGTITVTDSNRPIPIILQIELKQSGEDEYESNKWSDVQT
jgi:hypothetical protein